MCTYRELYVKKALTFFDTLEKREVSLDTKFVSF